MRFICIHMVSREIFCFAAISYIGLFRFLMKCVRSIAFLFDVFCSFCWQRWRRMSAMQPSQIWRKRSAVPVAILKLTKLSQQMEPSLRRKQRQRIDWENQTRSPIMMVRIDWSQSRMRIMYNSVIDLSSVLNHDGRTCPGNGWDYTTTRCEHVVSICSCCFTADRQWIIASREGVLVSLVAAIVLTFWISSSLQYFKWYC